MEPKNISTFLPPGVDAIAYIDCQRRLGPSIGSRLLLTIVILFTFCMVVVLLSLLPAALLLWWGG